eukprot:m.34899 g.34899  ORF g.34899 m.34899 type:complete len:246 (-) comp9558_c0_seq2:215-952(-)
MAAPEGGFDHTNAAVMLAQLSALHSQSPTLQGADLTRAAVGLGPWAFWPPAVWPGLGGTQLPMFPGAAAAAAAQAVAAAAAVAAANSNALVAKDEPLTPAQLGASRATSPGDERTRGEPLLQSSDEDSQSHVLSVPQARATLHSGTQRRPQREDYASESEFLNAFHRWRQVRDRNNDAVKRSREKYKMRKKSAAEAPVATRGETADQQIESLKIKLAVLAKAHSKHQLTHAENEEVRRIMLEYAP